jgi:hypothetical protein
MASLYSALKRRRLAFSGTSGSGGLGMPPGSTLILGAVIVTVMSWECSLSPSSVIEGGEVSQLMLAGRVPRLRYLGLRNAEIADQLAAALATAPVVAQLEVLDLSMGVLTDQGATALLTGQPLTHLRQLDLHHHYLSDELAGRLRQQVTSAGVEVDLSEREDPGEDNEERYVAVGE